MKDHFTNKKIRNLFSFYNKKSALLIWSLLCLISVLLIGCKRIPIEEMDQFIVKKLERRYGKTFKIKKSSYHWNYSQDSGYTYTGVGFAVDNPNLEFNVTFKMKSSFTEIAELKDYSLTKIEDNYLSQLMEQSEKRVLNEFLKQLYGRSFSFTISMGIKEDKDVMKIPSFNSFLKELEKGSAYYNLHLDLFTNDLSLEKKRKLNEIVQFLKARGVANASVSANFYLPSYQSLYNKSKEQNNGKFVAWSVSIDPEVYNAIQNKFDFNKKVQVSCDKDNLVLERLKWRYGKAFEIKKSFFSYQNPQGSGYLYKAIFAPVNSNLEFEATWKMGSDLEEIQDNYAEKMLEKDAENILTPFLQKKYKNQYFASFNIISNQEKYPERMISQTEFSRKMDIRTGKISFKDFAAAKNEDLTTYYNLSLNVFTDESAKQNLDNLYSLVQFLKQNRIKKVQININYYPSFCLDKSSGTRNCNNEFTRGSIFLSSYQYEKIKNQRDFEREVKMNYWGGYLHNMFSAKFDTQ